MAQAIILRDGRVAQFREAQNSDEDVLKLQELFASASDESRYFRFFRVVREVRPSDIRLMLRSDGWDQFTLLCMSEDRAIGVGTYSKSGNETAEVAFFVGDEDQGRGIGTLLLEHLAAVAFEYGFRKFEASVLEENHRMQRVFLSSGYEVAAKSDASMVRMELPLYQTERTRSLADLREKHAVAASLRPFLEPSAIAVIGASRRVESLGQMLFQHIVQGRFTGTVYPVNKEAASVAAVRAYKRVSEIPEAVQLAIIIVPSDEVEGVVEDCLHAGIHAVIVVSSGFAERDPVGVRLQTKLLRRMREFGCRMLGPNSLGVVATSPRFQLNASLAPRLPLQGKLAMASQSGALGIAILEYATRTGVGIASFVSTGNRADISSNDLLQYWEDDPDARIIALYLETFGNPRTFSRIARRVTRRKPIIAVKSARSSTSMQVSDMNRTALLADDFVVDALFRQTGIIRVDTLPELFDVAALLGASPLPAGRRVAVVTNSAGGAVMAVDAIVKFGLEFVGPVLDLGSDALANGYASVLPAVFADPLVDAILVVFIPVGVSEQNEVLDAIAVATANAKVLGINKPVIANFLVTADSMVHVERTGSESLPVYPFPEQAARALAHFVDYASYLKKPVGRVPDLPNLDVELARKLAQPPVSDPNAGPTCLVQSRAVELLVALGMPMRGVNHRAGRGQPTAGSARLHATVDPLFGPVIRLLQVGMAAGMSLSSWHDQDEDAWVLPTGREPCIRLAPLTDADCDAMMDAAFGANLDTANRELLFEILLRLSRLMDEVHTVADVVLTVHLAGEDESGFVDERGAVISVRAVNQAAWSYRVLEGEES